MCSTLRGARAGRFARVGFLSWRCCGHSLPPLRRPFRPVACSPTLLSPSPRASPHCSPPQRSQPHRNARSLSLSPRVSPSLQAGFLLAVIFGVHVAVRQTRDSTYAAHLSPAAVLLPLVPLMLALVTTSQRRASLLRWLAALSPPSSASELFEDAPLANELATNLDSQFDRWLHVTAAVGRRTQPPRATAHHARQLRLPRRSAPRPRPFLLCFCDGRVCDGRANVSLRARQAKLSRFEVAVLAVLSLYWCLQSYLSHYHPTELVVTVCISLLFGFRWAQPSKRDGEAFCLSIYVTSMTAAEISGLTIEKFHGPDEESPASDSTNYCDVQECKTLDECSVTPEPAPGPA